MTNELTENMTDLLTKKIHISSILFGLSDRTGKATRLGIILELIKNQEISRRELCQELSITEVNLIQHLGKLESVGLVDVDPRGKISLNKETLNVLINFWSKLIPLIP